ncbi:MAG: LacI family DNA-binding transcriptional regulator [Planctomycetota bacterium]
MTVTLQQIADEAGVAKTTVSRVLNGQLKENRPAIVRRAERIRQAAQRLGYRPNQAARSVTTGRFNQLACVTCGDLGFDWFAAQLLHGLHEGVEEIESRLMVHELTWGQIQDPDNVPRLFRESAVDGILANVDARLPQGVVDLFDEQPVPIVLLNVKRRTRCVYPDEYAGGWHAAAHLLAHGCRRPGYFAFHKPGPVPHFSVVDRKAGFDACLRSAGVEPIDPTELEAEFLGARRHGVAFAEAFFDRYGPCDGLACDRLPDAFVLHRVAAQRGIEIPVDLRLVVFNQQIMYGESGMAMDTLLTPYKQVGLEGVRMTQAMTMEGAPRRPEAQAVPYRRLITWDDGITHDLDPSVVQREGND